MTPRESDERVLAMIKLRCAGQLSDQIGKPFGMSGEFVRTATNKVLKADALESGEDVSGAYWDYTTGPKKAGKRGAS